MNTLEKKQPGQKMLISDMEIALIKSTFVENDGLLQIMRSLFEGLEVSQSDRELIKSIFSNNDLRNLIIKRFYPTINGDSPIGQTVDIWLGPAVDGKGLNEIREEIIIYNKFVKLLKKALALLDNPFGESVDLGVNIDSNIMVEDPFFSTLLARNKFIKYIESQLVMLKVIAGQKEETPQQAKKRLEGDSNK